MLSITPQDLFGPIGQSNYKFNLGYSSHIERLSGRQVVEILLYPLQIAFELTNSRWAGAKANTERPF